MKDPLRIPPQSLESERGLLGALLLKPDAIHDVGDLVRPESFYAEKHKVIYEAMRELIEKGNPVDLLSMSERLQANGHLERIGGRAYLAELTNAVPSPGNYAHYADLVSRKHLMRSLIDTTHEIAEHAYDESRDTHQVLDDAEKAVMAIGTNITAQKFQPIKDTFGDVVDFIDSLTKREDGIRGVPTGLPELDKLLSGLHPSDLIILAARPSVGKTSLALNIARHAAVKENVPVGIFSLEMGAEQLRDRLLAAESGVDAWRIRTNSIPKEDIDNVMGAIERLQSFAGQHQIRLIRYLFGIVGRFSMPDQRLSV